MSSSALISSSSEALSNNLARSNEVQVNNSNFSNHPIKKNTDVAIEVSESHTHIAFITQRVDREPSSSFYPGKYAAHLGEDSTHDQAQQNQPIVSSSKKCCWIFPLIITNLLILTAGIFSGYNIDKEDRYSPLWGGLVSFGIDVGLDLFIAYKYCRS